MHSKPTYEELEQSVKELKSSVSDCREAIQTLQKSEKKYRLLVENIDIGITMIDPDLNVIFANKAVGKWFDKPAAEFVGKKCYQEFEKKSQPCPHCPGLEALKTGKPCEIESEGIREDGSSFTVRDRAFPLFEENGELIGFNEIVEDITVSKKHELELRKERDFSKLVLDTAQSIMLVLNLDGTINSFNPYMEEVSGYTLEEVKGKDWFETFLPTRDWKNISHLFKKAINDIEVRGNINLIVTKDGRELSIEWYAKTLKDDTGRPLGVLSIGQDVTERIQTEKKIKQSETRLQLALDAADITIWDWGIQTGEIYFSPNYFTMLGYQCDELPCSYESWSALLHDEDRELAVAEIKRCLLKGMAWDIEFRLKTKQGEYKWVRGKGNVVEKDTEGKALRASGTHLDISDHKRAEEDRLKLLKLESVGMLAGGIAHDFNNILVAILGNVNLALLDSQLNPETRKLLMDAEKASLRAKGLTQQLLTFSKGGEPIKETASLEEVVQDSAEFVLHGEKSVSKYEIPNDLWLVEIDKGQISQVIQNTILNANQAMPDGGTIEISCENYIQNEASSTNVLRAGSYIKVRIKDCGVGIPANMIGRVFDPYFSTKQKGSGLGLAITHSIITKHDGDIQVESTPGHGSTFTIFIPASEQTLKESRKEKEIETDTAKARVMIMDDEGLVRKMLQVMLTTMGHETVIAKDGVEALALFKQAMKSGSPIDLTIMDLTIPGGMGGKEAVKEILSLDTKAKVIVSSGYSTAPVMADYQKYGFCGTLTKPYQLKDLDKAIREAIHVENGV